MGAPSIVFQKPCLALEVGTRGEFLSGYYNEIAPVLYELGVPLQTIPVLAKDTPLQTLRLAQVGARREDLESLIRPLIPKAEEHFGSLPGRIVIYLSELFDHYAWASEGEWTMVINPAFPEDFETQFVTQVAHNLSHCARYNRMRDVYKREGKFDLFNVEHRRQFRVNLPLAEDVINEGIAAVGSRFIVDKYPALETRATWYESQISRLLQEFIGARNVSDQNRILFMNDRSALPPGENWQLLPKEFVYVGYYLGWFLVNHALAEIKLPFKRLLEQSANEILNLSFSHMQRSQKEENRES
ncbi:MAG: hypothetical protein RBG13Loki_2055 [Promethearchaeota archaeon CR_4]|nr:MAG: hypothetical protein RBG13Loki_2055 [Candidatus Lokiarchaeota archaeon CR_4]